MDTAADTPAEASADRGRAAGSPRALPASAWRDVLWRTWLGFNTDSIAIVARSVAFSGLMALFPTLAAAVSIYGLFGDPSAVQGHLRVLAGVVPNDVLVWLRDEISRIAAQRTGGLGLTLLLALLVAVWSVNAGVKALIRGLNIAYQEQEKRNLLRVNITSLAFTLGAFLFVVATVTAIVVVPIVLHFLRIPRGALPLAELRWPLLLLLAFAGFAAVYRWGPSRERAQWRWVTWGAAMASGLWLLASLLFSWYLAGFADYNATYGSLGALFGFITWSWLSSVVILLGAKLNAEIEHQTRVDTTTGPEAELGERGAFVADHVGKPHPKGWLGKLLKKRSGSGRARLPGGAANSSPRPDGEA